MTSQALLAPPAVFQLAPPYDRFEVVPDAAAFTPADLRDAALLAVGAGPPQDGWGDLAALVAELRARFPAAPVVLRLGQQPAGDGEVDWDRRASELGVRAVVFDGESPRPRLLRTLTDASALSEQIGQWLRLRLPGLAPGVRELIDEIVRLSPRFGEVGPLLGSIGHAERTARTWFRRAGTPGPGKWLATAHAVRAALRMQAESASPLLTLAVECGYSDHSSLSRQSLRLFGVRPGAIRRTLGWEWLLDRWLRRAGL
jgi:AraC-like DNA-binding protein